MRYLLYGLLVLLLASLLTSVTQVRPGERAVVRRFGRVLEDKARPGLLIGLPWGLDRVDRVPVDLLRRVSVGFDPALEESEGGTPAGQLLTGDQNLVNARVVLQYSVVENELEKFVVQQDRVDDLVARAAETVLTEWAAGRSVDDILLNGKAELPGVLVKETQERLEDYELGIRIRDASVTLLVPPAEVKDAFDAVNQAQTAIRTKRYQEEQNATEERGRAEAEVDRLLQEAEAEAEEQRQRARTDAANFLKRLRKLRRFLAKNPGELPDYLHDLWLSGMKKVRERMRAGGGRIEPLDKFLGFDRINVLQGSRPDGK